MDSSDGLEAPRPPTPSRQTPGLYPRDSPVVVPPPRSTDSTNVTPARNQALLQQFNIQEASPATIAHGSHMVIYCWRIVYQNIRHLARTSLNITRTAAYAWRGRLWDEEALAPNISRLRYKTIGPGCSIALGQPQRPPPDRRDPPATNEHLTSTVGYVTTMVGPGVKIFRISPGYGIRGSAAQEIKMDPKPNPHTPIRNAIRAATHALHGPIARGVAAFGIIYIGFSLSLEKFSWGTGIALSIGLGVIFGAGDIERAIDVSLGADWAGWS
ncbi:hypothetical protein FGG08_004869 [Glutinoglossum americanum]|uniref:Uncharacterized protein n=1 Tax=Glutinoglossum americanum TaxID=1670608 RepID=A0A9P8HZC3_9PEZI|nr:hypothetical protein FGG08_004869 [Glutinoglossum americanum]